MPGMPTESASKSDHPDIVITHAEANGTGRYEARLANVRETSELTYSRMNAETIIADHTYVPDALRGRGIAQILVERLVADARAGGYRIVPVCPYIEAQYGKHPEWSDVMQINPDE